MNSEFENIKKKMSETEGQLPPELGWEEMQDGIFDKLDALESAVPVVSKTSWHKRIAFGISLAFLLLLMTCGQFGLNSIATSELETTSKKDESTKSAVISNKEISITQKQSTENLSTERDLTNANTNVTAQPTRMSDEVIGQVQNQASTNQFHNASNSLGIKLADDITNFKKEVATSIPWVVTEKQSQNMPLLALLPQKNSILNFVLQTTNPKSVITDKRAYKPKPQEPIFFKNRLLLLSGISFWNLVYGNTKPERAPFEKGFLSYHGKVNYIHTFKNNFTLLTGLEYQKLETEFDGTVEIDNYQLNKEDIVLEIRNNALTNAQTEVRGNAAFTVNAEHELLRYNQTHLYQIPLGVGKTWCRNNWQTDLLLGGTINLFSFNKGKTIYQNQVIEYKGSSTDFLDNQMKFHAFLKGFVTYKINQRLGLTTGFQLQKGLSNWSKESDTTMHPEILNLSVGLSYGLD